MGTHTTDHGTGKAHSNGNPIPDMQARKHPEEYQDDLNPAPLAGTNYGLEGPNPEKNAATADEYKQLHERLPQFREDELRQLPVLPEGSRLKQGATYFDLASPERGEFTATADMIAGPQNRYIPKSEVDYQLWNRLIGVENPERLGEADDS